MVNSPIGSNFHRKSGGDERRGIFSKLPPLSIPNSLRRLTSNSPPRNERDSSSSPSTTSSAVVAIGSLIALVPPKTSIADNFRPKTSTTSATTPSSALPLSAFSPSSSTRSSADTELTTPGSGPQGSIALAMRPGLLPDASPGKTYFPVVTALPDGQAKVITWEERRYNFLGLQRGSDSSQVIAQRSSKGSGPAPNPTVFDATPNRVDTGANLEDAEIAIQHLRQLSICGLGPKMRTPGGNAKLTQEIETPTLSWDPRNPGHDTWNECGRDEKWQHRSQLFSSLSAFNMRNAQKRRSPTPKPEVGPGGEGADHDNDPTTPRDVGRLVEQSDFFSTADTTLLKPVAISPVNTPPSGSLDLFDVDETPQYDNGLPKVTLSLPSGSKRITVALPCSDLVDLKEEDEEDLNEHRQSLFDLSEEESEDAEEEIAELSDNEFTISIKSRTAKDSRRASVLRRTSSAAGTLEPVRSRGESIGLEDCSQDPMVLAAGFEKKIRGSKTFSSSGAAGAGAGARSKRECYVYHSSGSVGRERWEVCPGREALGVERAKGRDRGKTM